MGNGEKKNHTLRQNPQKPFQHLNETQYMHCHEDPKRKAFTTI